jgi:hypothetical protein
MMIISTSIAGEDPFLALTVVPPIPMRSKKAGFELLNKGLVVETKILDNVTLRLGYGNLSMSQDTENEHYVKRMSQGDIDMITTHMNMFTYSAAMTYYTESVFKGLYGRLGFGYFTSDSTYMNGNLSETTDVVVQNYTPYFTAGYNMTFIDCVTLGGGLGVQYNEFSYTTDGSNSKTKQRVIEQVDAKGGFSLAGDLNVSIYI